MFSGHSLLGCDAMSDVVGYQTLLSLSSPLHITAWPYNQEDHDLNLHHHGNLTYSYILHECILVITGK